MAVMYDVFDGKSDEEGNESMLVDKSSPPSSMAAANHSNSDGRRDQRNAKSTTPSTSFAKQYPSSKPQDAEKGGWDNVFGRDLTMYVGFGTNASVRSFGASRR